MHRKLICSALLLSAAAFAQGEKPATEKPAAEKPAADKPAADKPAAAKTDAAPGGGPAVTDAKLGTDVQNAEVVGEGTTFKADESKVYLWTVVTGLEGQEITHAWYRGNDKVSEVKLPVKYNPTKTWSYKTLHAGFPGDWHVDVLGPDGAVLKTVAFKVE